VNTIVPAATPSNKVLYGVKNCPGCRENFLMVSGRSNCQQVDNPGNNFNPTPIRVEITG
jgi:uncharacterized protein YcgI (DUF1989 family)